jgi:hypothetical protein
MKKSHVDIAAAARRAVDRLVAAGHKLPPSWDGRLGRAMTLEESREHGAFLILLGQEIRNEPKGDEP